MASTETTPTAGPTGPGADTSAAASTAANAAAKAGSGELRSDAEPLLKRFPLLGQPVALHWMSGTLGDARVPGPSTYWIDAIVDLPAERAIWLRQTYSVPAAGQAAAKAYASATTTQPALAELPPQLQGLLAPGAWQASPELDAALSQQGFVVRAYLQGNRLLLLAMGQ